MDTTIEGVRQVWYRQTLLAKPVKPSRCRDCGEAILFVSSDRKHSYYPVDVVRSETEPGKVVPLVGQNHLTTCVIAILERKRATQQPSTEVPAVKSDEPAEVRVTLTRGNESVAVVASGNNKSEASEHARAKLAEYPGFEVSRWAVVSLAN